MAAVWVGGKGKAWLKAEIDLEGEGGTATLASVHLKDAASHALRACCSPRPLRAALSRPAGPRQDCGTVGGAVPPAVLLHPGRRLLRWRRERCAWAAARHAPCAGPARQALRSTGKWGWLEEGDWCWEHWPCWTRCAWRRQGRRIEEGVLWRGVGALACFRTSVNNTCPAHPSPPPIPHAGGAGAAVG